MTALLDAAPYRRGASLKTLIFAPFLPDPYPQPESKWRCRFENPLLEPKRKVSTLTAEESDAGILVSEFDGLGG